jgi:SAM-dependent methyltransferase
METNRLWFRFAAALLLGLYLTAGCAFAQPRAERAAEEPQSGQEGKDVIWLPSEQALVDRMLNLAKVTPDDYVIDLGSGDGRIVIAAARLGARALGIEYNPQLVQVSKQNALRAGVADRARFVQGDIFESDFSAATVLTLFLLPELNVRLMPQILALKPGTRIVSNSFGMGYWVPDQTLAVSPEEGCNSTYCMTILWIVPARVEGHWKLPQGDLLLKQEYQRLYGVLKNGNDLIPLTDSRLDGSRIHFRIAGTIYSGEVTGDTMQGVFSGGQGGEWQARRVAP